MDATIDYQATVEGTEGIAQMERHCLRGLRPTEPHPTLAVTAFQTTALVHILKGNAIDAR